MSRADIFIWPLALLAAFMLGSLIGMSSANKSDRDQALQEQKRDLLKRCCSCTQSEMAQCR